MYKTRIAWNDYFEIGNPTTLTDQEYTSRQTPTGSGVYVTNCFFKSCTYSGNGGALYCTSQYLFVESTTFFSCKGNSQCGGSIYFFNNDGKCILYRTCAYDCCSTYSSYYSHGQFAHIEITNIDICKTYVNYSSISCCITTSSITHRTLNFIKGNIYCPSVNYSMNKCQYCSGVYYKNGGASSFTCLLSYSTFTDNIAMGHNCIMYDNVGNRCDIKSCNILRNIQNTNSYGTIYTDRNLMIENSCILGNRAAYIFYQASSYTITLSNCTVDLTTHVGNFISQNTATKSFVHTLNHMSTENCFGEYDSLGTLTPQNEKIIYYTCKKNHARISEFFSLNSVFMIALIHPDPSN
jgi:hypothetical protein